MYSFDGEDWLAEKISFSPLQKHLRKKNKYRTEKIEKYKNQEHKKQMKQKKKEKSFILA